MTKLFKKFTLVLALAMAIAFTGTGAALYREYEKTTRLELALQIWQNCPMPTKGIVLVVESDWEGKAEGEDFRCFHARKPGRNLRPTVEPKAYDHRCRGGLCV